MTVSRYHPALVILHWFVAVLLFLQLAGGFLVLAPMANTDPAKLDILKFHMMAGTSILVLMLVRVIIRWRTNHPEPSVHQRTGIGQLRTPVHLALYLVLFLAAATGWVTGYLISNVYATPGGTLPADFEDLPSRELHEWFVFFLVALIALHIAAAIREHLSGDKTILARMGFGPRAE